MNKFLMAATIAVVALLGYGAGIYFPAVVIPSAQDRAPAAPAEPEPLYWVAPMDASFRRDGPGKSPMGMDLVPVYASDKSPAAGEVSIAPQVQQHLGLRTARAERTTMVTPLTAVGFVGFDQQALRHFHLRATGWVSELSVVAEGDPVRKGQKLFEFYSPEILNTQQEYLSALNGNHTALAQSAALKLKAQGVSEREITAIARERKLRPQLSYYADRDGYVAAISISNGSYVELDQSTLSIGTLDDVWVLAEVFERSADLLHQGQAVTLTSRSYPGEQWLGEIDYVYPVLNAANRTVKARIVFPNSDGRLKPNMLVDLAIAAAPAENTLVIPTSAVIRTGQSTRVVRQVRDDVYRSTPVRVGRSAGGNTEVLDGLRDGDRVVVNAQFLIDSESNIDAELARIGEGEAARANDSEAEQPQEIDHKGEGHKTDDHQAMDHHKMDHHSTMSHDGMNHSGFEHPQVAP
ncbi:efflux RND transporter periplasmic adaptor subunit [Gilvimarinus japonicus]|uniref:Efflux RND transporter periplasmic adaptor subunit n=1 Tax=Gilvimarinus japonicus TaxID=1796469 RepID=A0ABV7HPK1_9GAMM